MVRIRSLLLVLLLGVFSASAQSVRELYRVATEAVNQGNYSSAVKAYRQIISRLPQDSAFAVDRAFYLRPYSNLLLSLGAHEEVEELLRDSAYVDDIVLQINRASALGYQEKYDAALQLLELVCRRELDDPFRGKLLQNQAFLYMQSGRLASAALKFREALPYFSGFQKNIVESNLALCLARMGRFSESNSLIALVLRGLNGGRPATERDYIRALRKAAEIYSIQGNQPVALARFREYFTLERRWLIDNLSQLSVDTRLNLWMSEKALLSGCFVLEDYSPEFLFEVAMFRRLTSMLGMRDVDNLSALLSLSARDVRHALKHDEAAVEFISYVDKSQTERYAAIILPQKGAPRFVKLFSVEEIYEPEVVATNSIFNAIKRDDPAEKNLLYSDVTLADEVWAPILKALPAEVTSIFFAPEGIFHFWGIENMPFTGREKYQLHRLTSTASLVNRTDLIRESSAPALIIGGLNYASMPADSVVSSPNHEAADVIADHVGHNDIFNFLPGTRTEADSICCRLNLPSPVYSVGEAELKAMMPDFRLIHIATHGYSLNLGIKRRPEFLSDSLAIDQSLNAAGLALSGANIACLDPTREDALLSAREICDLDLSGVDFVVLSACQTAQGDITDEGAAGLVRGLKNAGVKTVMASLWSVDDRSTMLFMREFYRLLDSGRSKHQAYVGAQNFLRNYSKRIPVRRFSPSTLSPVKSVDYNVISYDAPFFWAPFILIDDF